MTNVIQGNNDSIMNLIRSLVNFRERRGSAPADRTGSGGAARVTPDRPEFLQLKMVPASHPAALSGILLPTSPVRLRDDLFCPSFEV